MSAPATRGRWSADVAGAIRPGRGREGDRRGPLRSKRGRKVPGRGNYPQVDPGAGGLIDVPLARVRRRARVTEALRVAVARGADVVSAGDGRWALREDLHRAAGLGLGGLPAGALARPLPAVGVDEREVRVRRLLAAGAPAVVVCDRRGALGAVKARPGPVDDGPALGRWFTERLSGAARDAVATLTRIAAECGARAFLAGGTVRDALLDEAPGRDLDVVVEGDGLAVARALAAALGVVPGRALVEHARFLTASLTLPAGSRIDVATARAERYETPGALPRVMPATIGQDLARRDFTVNALAVALSPGGLGLLDRFGGRADLARRRLRVLHPLSFVEDPTRIFRAARYAARLGLTVDAWTARALRLALQLAPYPALSGPRLVAELERILADVRPEAALHWLGVAGAYRLLDPRYRFTRGTAARLRALPAARAWSVERAMRVTPLELAALALVGAQPSAVARAALARLGLSGEPLGRLEHALDSRASLARRLRVCRRPSERARSLWDRSDVELAWLWLSGDAAVRAGVDWFLAHARGVRPLLSGDDVVALGVPRGPGVARVLAALRDLRLDEIVRDRDAEVASVQDWMTERGGGAWLPSSSS